MGEKNEERVDLPLSERAKRRSRKNVRTKYLQWQKLDNSAHLFPLIAGEVMTNTYRIAVEMEEEVDPELLSQALDIVLPKFPLFNVRLRRGFFWFYLEENGKKAPRIREESKYPCRLIHQKLNNNYLFRVTYFRNRINIEVYHVLTDGMGTINFLKELVYQYLRLLHPELKEIAKDRLCAGTSMSTEDSFLRNYRKSAKKKYASEAAYRIKGQRLRGDEMAVMHCRTDVNKLKAVAKSRGLSINEYLVGNYMYSIYRACLHEGSDKSPVRIAVPVNLRGFFDSITTKNFFAMISAEFKADKDGYSREEVMEITKESLRKQINKEYLEEIFSYNVSNQQVFLLRAVPLWIKGFAIRYIYKQSAKANTTTLTNLGNLTVNPIYAPYIKNFNVVISLSLGHDIKATVISYNGILTVTFSSLFRETNVQQEFVRQLVADGLDVTIETNGVYYEYM